MLPLLPPSIDMLTLPMKSGVSYATKHLLFWMGCPFSRSGVVLVTGPCRLLVAL